MSSQHRLPSLSASLGPHTSEPPDYDEKFRTNYWFDPLLAGVDSEGTLDEQIERSVASIEALLSAYRYQRSIEDEWGILRQAA